MRRSEKRKSEKKEEAGARKGRKVALTLFLTDLWPWRVEKSPCFGALLEVAMSKKCTPLWHEAHVPVKMYQTHQVRTTLEVAMSKKCTPLWPEAHFQVKMMKIHMLGPHLDVQMSFCVASARDCAPCRKLAKRVGFVSVSATTTNTVHCTTPHYIIPHCTPLHHTTPHYTHYTTRHFIQLHYTTLHYTPHPPYHFHY